MQCEVLGEAQEGHWDTGWGQDQGEARGSNHKLLLGTTQQQNPEKVQGGSVLIYTREAGGWQQEA